MIVFAITIHPADTQRLYNVCFRAYLRYVIYKRLHVVTTYANVVLNTFK